MQRELQSVRARCSCGLNRSEGEELEWTGGCRDVWCDTGGGVSELGPSGEEELATTRGWAAVWCYKGAGGIEWGPSGEEELATTRGWAAVWCYKGAGGIDVGPSRSEDHTSELQSCPNSLSRLLLEKPKLLPSSH